MPEPIVHELMERLPNVRLYNAYGQTEMSPVATVLGPEDHKICPASAGKPVFNVETRIVNEDMQDVAVGEQGEIVHRSAHVMAGYWNKPEETAEAFKYFGEEHFKGKVVINRASCRDRKKYHFQF